MYLFFMMRSAPDVLDEVQGARESALHHLEGVLPLWRVSPERQDVLDAIALHLQCASQCYQTVHLPACPSLVASGQKLCHM